MLYTESDGLWVHLQREAKEHYELKSAIAYEGWERIPGGKERYRLVNKRIYSHSDESIPFWEGASLQWDRWWDSGRLELTVLGGDGANWIESGTSEILRVSG